MKYIEALDEYIPQIGEVSLFLGGGITNCADWQAVMVDLLKDSDLVLLNPRRDNFPMGDKNATPLQIDWEFRHLKLATKIMFWFTSESLCPITLFEYGKWLTRDKPLFVGCHPEYKRIEDVKVQTALEQPNLEIFTDLSSLAAKILNS